MLPMSTKHAVTDNTEQRISSIMLSTYKDKTDDIQLLSLKAYLFQLLVRASYHQAGTGDDIARQAHYATQVITR